MANLITNGGFTNSPCANSDFQPSLSICKTTVTPNIITPWAVDLVSGSRQITFSYDPGAVPMGYGLALISDNNAPFTIRQSVNVTIPLQAYMLSFLMRCSDGCRPSMICNLSYSVGSTQNLTTNMDVLNPTKWSNMTYTFGADSNTTQIMFWANETNSDCYPVLTDVRLQRGATGNSLGPKIYDYKPPSKTVEPVQSDFPTGASVFTSVSVDTSRSTSSANMSTTTIALIVVAICVVLLILVGLLGFYYFHRQRSVSQKNKTFKGSTTHGSKAETICAPPQQISQTSQESHRTIVPPKRPSFI